MSFEVGRDLKSHEPFRLNISDIVTKRTFIVSATRFGKSWKARKIIEECVGHAGIIIVDPEGEYASLREKFPFMIIGKDVPLQLETAEFMAEKVLEAKVSVIIDLSLIEEELGKDYVNKFLRRFFFLETTIRQPYLIVIEECEDYGPERGSPATSTCLGIIINLVKKGGKRGIGVLLVAHRPAWVSKGIVAQCGNKAVGRMEEVADDLNVLERYARIPHDAIQRLTSLDKGEFCLAGDWVKNVTFVKVGPVKTTHLGFTPETIPRAPKEVQTVIAGLQNSLSKVIEAVKPTVVSTAQLETKIRSELEGKFKDRINAILKTADEKADRKFRVENDRLKLHIEELSRSKALEPTSPISDVLDHPIVKSRMLELDEKARILLTKVEREPGVTREQLAAFLTASRDSIANLIAKINRVFRAQVIVGEGKPIHYKSMLKRLYITDVGKREIEELQRMQAQLLEQGARITALDRLRTTNAEEIQRLQSELRGNTTRQGDLERARNENVSLHTIIDTMKIKVDQLIKENQAFQKIKEGFAALGAAAPIDEATVEAIVKRALGVMTPTFDEASLEAIVKKRVDECVSAAMSKLPTSASAEGTAITLEHRITHFDWLSTVEHLKIDASSLQGRILSLVLKGFFEERHNRKQIVTELSNCGWLHEDKEVDAALLELCGKGVFYRKIGSGNLLWYNLQPEAKERIHE